MKRLGAVALAILMVAGAVVLRGRLDDDSTDREDDTPFRLTCATELSTVCAALRDSAADDGIGIEVTVRDPGATSDALSELPAGESTGFDAWLVDGPWPEITLDNRRFAGLSGEVFGEPSEVLARSPVVLATQRSGRADLESACGGNISWRCVGEQVPPQRVGLPTPERGDGLAVLASATDSYFGGTDYSAVDFQEPEFTRWFDQLTRLSAATPLGRQTPLDRALAAAGTFTTVGALEAQSARLLRGEKPYEAIYPEPMVTADVVLVPGPDLTAADALSRIGRDRLIDALEQGAWRIDGAAPEGGDPDVALPDGPNMPAPGVLQTLRDLW